MNLYVVISPILHWSFKARSHEEAHCLAKSAAAKWLNTWKTPGFHCRPDTRKEVVRVLSGKFEVVKEIGEL
jgi:hypothetical protein